MLLIQEIKLTWDKMERNAKSANARNQFPFAYTLPQTNTYDNVMLHIQYFRQHNTQFLNSYQPRRQIYCYSSIEKLHLLKNISIVPYENEYEICFCGDGYSWPYMRGHNKDYYNIKSQYYGKDCLNEVAFTLKQHQYGRIIWNGRMVEFDTGEWYYNIYVYNFYVADKMPQNDIFISHTPDFVYKKMSMLYRH